MSDGYMTYTAPLSVRFWRRLGFHSPSAPLLSADKIADGWDEQVFVHTTLTVSFLDRLRLLISGEAKLFTIVSAKVKIPEAITGVSFAVSAPFSRHPSSSTGDGHDQ